MDPSWVQNFLLVIIGFFLVRLITQVDTTSKSVDRLSHTLEKLNTLMQGFEKEATQRHETIQQRFGEFHEEMEMARNRIHTLFSWVTAIRLQGELKNGWSFKNVWSMGDKPD